MTRAWLALLLVPAPLAAQSPELRNGPAATGCVAGVPVTTYAPDLAPAIRAQLEVHESVHRRQLAVGVCEATLAAILADPLKYADAEAEAGCGQLVATTEPQTLPFALGTLTAWLRSRFPTLADSTLIRLVAQRCGLWPGS